MYISPSEKNPQRIPLKRRGILRGFSYAAFMGA
jgi:hypothetical protein